MQRLALPRRQQLREIIGQRRQPGRHFALALLRLEQLVRDVERRENRRLVGFHDRPLGEHLLQGLIDVGRDLARVLGRQVGAHRVLLPADHHLDRVLLRAHAVPPLTAVSRACSASAPRPRTARPGSRKEQCHATRRCPDASRGPRYSSNSSSRSSSGPAARRNAASTAAAVTPGGSTSARSRSTGGVTASGVNASGAAGAAAVSLSRTSKPNSAPAHTGASASSGPAQPVTTPLPRCTATQPPAPPEACATA